MLLVFIKLNSQILNCAYIITSIIFLCQILSDNFTKLIFQSKMHPPVF